jgi:hypothetical protein
MTFWGWQDGRYPEPPNGTGPKGPGAGDLANTGIKTYKLELQFAVICRQSFVNRARSWGSSPVGHPRALVLEQEGTGSNRQTSKYFLHDQRIRFRKKRRGATSSGATARA